MLPKIIYEDDSFFILDKPAGWIVNNAETTKDQPVIEKWLKKKDYPLSGVNEYRSGIVHRLDKPTSGILIVAKTKRVFKALQAQFKERLVKKTYTALLHGKLVPREGWVNVPLGRLPWNRMRFGVLAGGRESKTKYKVVNFFEGENGNLYSLVEFYPKTGRTHQIRIHAKYLNHPIVSDDFYAGRKVSRDDKKWCKRLFLHASKISFKHPIEDKAVSFTSDLPNDLRSCVLKLEKV